MAIEVVARDWDRPDWCGGFYPEDLPEDWRLTYFATVVDSVLVPSTIGDGAPPGRLAQWAEDVPQRFRCYLELGPADETRRWAGPPSGTTPGMDGVEPRPEQRLRTPKEGHTLTRTHAVTALQIF